MKNKLLKIKDKYHLGLIVAHVNHNVRSESYVECEYIKKYCEESNIDLVEYVYSKEGHELRSSKHPIQRSTLSGMPRN